MDDTIRMRTRPRPYDLRRKVLLKNFLREQMTHIPFVSASSSHDDEMDPTIEDPECSDEENENNDVFVNDDDDSCTDAGTTSELPNLDESTENDNQRSLSETVKPKKCSRFTSFLKTKMAAMRSSKHKAKSKPKMKSSKSILYRALKKPNKSSKTKHSLLSLLKVKREKSSDETDSTSSSQCSSSSNTANQCVQTDKNWLQEQYKNVEEDNKSLREENRLLSESLSSLMSDFTLQLSPLKVPFGNESYITSSGTTTVLKQSENIFVRTSQLTEKEESNKSRVLRSRSLHQANDRKNYFRLRTRSMNCGYSNNNLSQQPLKRFHKKRASLPSLPSVPDLKKHSEESIHEQKHPIIRRSSSKRKWVPTSSIEDYNFDDHFDNSDQTFRNKRRRSANFGKSVAFQDLPREAFY